MTNKAKETGEVTGRKWLFNIILFAVLAVLTIMLFHNFVFSDEMLYGSDTIQAGVFFRSFYVDYVHEYGKVPVWNPYQFCGIPYVDGFHGDTYYPFSILKFFMNIFRALGWNLLLHVIIAGITMFFCARAFKKSQLAATMAAISYMFAAYFISQVAPGHDGKMFVTALFPLTIMLIELAFRKRMLLCFGLLGLTIGVIILTPHPQMAYYTLWACAFYTIFKLINDYRDNKSISRLVKPGLLFSMAVIIGLSISAIHFYPGFVYVKKYSPRSDEKRGMDWARSWSLHAEEAFAMVVPEFDGVSGEKGNTYWGRNYFKDNSEYAGTVPLLFAIVAVAMVRSRKTWFFGGLAVFALIYGLSGDTPFFYLFYYLIPNVKSTRSWSMIMFLFSYSIALLAAFGLDFIIEQSRKLKEGQVLKFGIVLFILPILVLIGAMMFTAAPDAAIKLYRSVFYQSINPSRLQVLHGYVTTIAAGFLKTFLFITIPAVVAFLYSRRKLPLVVLWLIVAFAFFDAYRFDLQFIRTHNQGINGTVSTFSKFPIVDYVKSLPGKFRILNLAGRDMPTNYLPYFGIEELTSQHGNQPRWINSLMGGMQGTNVFNPNLLNMTNTRYLMISPLSQINGKRLDGPTLEKAGFPKTGEAGRFSLYENTRAEDRAYIVHHWVVEPDEKKLTDIILSGSFNPGTMVGMFEDPGIAPLPDSIDLEPQPVEIVSYENDYIKLKTSSAFDGVLVLADNWYPAWKGFISGKEVEVHRVNVAFRGIVLPAGDHEVEFKWISQTERTGKLLTLAGLLVVVGIVAGDVFIRRKKGAQEDKA